MDKTNQLLQGLRITLSKMELSLDAIDDAIIWIDKNGVIQWSNKKLTSYLKLSFIEILGKPIQNFLPLKIKNKLIDWLELLRNIDENSKPSIYEWNNDDNEPRYFEMMIRSFTSPEQKTNIIILLHDITDTYLNSLNKSKLAAIVEFTDDAIISRNLDGLIESWNKGAEHMYGYKAEDALGKSAGFIYPESHKEEFQYTNEQIKKGEFLEIADTVRIHKDGHIIPVSVTISPIRNEQGQVIGSCSIARDISELKKMLSMKNDFISTVSHELRTPLTSIQGSLSLLIGGTAGNLPEKAQALLKIGKDNTARLIRLINDILDIQKMESGRMEFHLNPVSINTLIEEAILANQAYAAQFNIKIKLIQETKATINIDHDKILQVLANLISNAVKFSSSNEIILRVCQKSKSIRVEITNKGVGIPKEFYSSIFQKFSQANAGSTKNSGGTGLGLNISKQIIEKHGGDIGFESEENKETTFFFELPIYQAPFLSGSYFEKIPVVLIFEIDTHLGKKIQNILEQNDVKVIAATTEKEIKKIIASQHIDAILLDLASSGPDSITLIKDLKALNSQLSIIVFSVSKQNGEKLIGNIISILDWIEKPTDLNRLIKAIKLLKKQTEIVAPKILHVEDDIDLMKVIANLLQEEANIWGVTNLKEARQLLEKNSYDLIILDLMLPDGYGVELLELISHKNIPIMVFSAYELPKNYSKYVINALIKSQTTLMEFINNVKVTLKKTKKR